MDIESGILILDDSIYIIHIPFPSPGSILFMWIFSLLVSPSLSLVPLVIWFEFVVIAVLSPV